MSFEHAPVTKGLMMLVAVTSLCTGVFDIKQYLHLQLVPHISRYHQYWRLFIHHLAYNNSSDLFLAELLFYNLGTTIERRFGSLKFSSFMVLSLLLSTLLEFLALLCLYPLGINTIPAGPNTFLFSLLHQHIRLVPSSYDLRVFGVPMTDKFFIYAPAFQMGLRSRSMVVVAAIGTLTGHLYRSELADLKQYRLPPALVRFSKIHLLPAMGSLQPPIRTLIALPTRITRPPRTAAATPAEGSTPADEGPITTARSLPAPGADTTNTGPSMMRQWVDELTGRAQNAEAGLRVPSEAEVTHVTSMFPGLGREVIVAALQRSANVEAAVETLMGSTV